MVVLWVITGVLAAAPTTGSLREAFDQAERDREALTFTDWVELARNLRGARLQVPAPAPSEGEALSAAEERYYADQLMLQAFYWHAVSHSLRFFHEERPAAPYRSWLAELGEGAAFFNPLHEGWYVSEVSAQHRAGVWAFCTRTQYGRTGPYRSSSWPPADDVSSVAFWKKQESWRYAKLQDLERRLEGAERSATPAELPFLRSYLAHPNRYDPHGGFQVRAALVVLAAEPRDRRARSTLVLFLGSAGEECDSVPDPFGVKRGLKRLGPRASALCPALLLDGLLEREPEQRSLAAEAFAAACPGEREVLARLKRMQRWMGKSLDPVPAISATETALRARLGEALSDIDGRIRSRAIRVAVLAPDPGAALQAKLKQLYGLALRDAALFGPESDEDAWTLLEGAFLRGQPELARCVGKLRASSARAGRSTLRDAGSAGCPALGTELERALGSWVTEPAPPLAQLAALVRSAGEAGSAFEGCLRGASEVVQVSLSSSASGLEDLRVTAPALLLGTTVPDCLAKAFRAWRASVPDVPSRPGKIPLTLGPFARD